MEMPGLWKAWKAHSRLPTLSTSPLGNLANRRRDSHIPTAPAMQADGKVENQQQVSHFSHRRDSSLFKPKTQRRRSALRYHNPTKGDAPQHLNFRLIPHWNQISISGSFLDWKMLCEGMRPLEVRPKGLAGGFIEK